MAPLTLAVITMRGLIFQPGPFTVEGIIFGTKDLRTIALDLGVYHDLLLFYQYILNKEVNNS